MVFDYLIHGFVLNHFFLTVLYVIYSAFSKSQRDRAGTTYQEASLSLSLLLEFSLELCVLPLFLKDFFSTILAFDYIF